MSTPIQQQIDRLKGVRSDIQDAFRSIGVTPPENMVFADVPELIIAIARKVSAVYYDTTSNWNTQTSLVAERRAIYVYSDHAFIDDGNGNLTPVPGLKIGDGTSYLIDMPFVADDIAEAITQHINNNDIHVSEYDRIFWNNKVSIFMDESDEENLVISKTTFNMEE